MRPHDAAAPRRSPRRRDDTVDDVRAKEAAWAGSSGDESPLASLAHGGRSLVRALVLAAASRRRRPKCAPPSTRSCGDDSTLDARERRRVGSAGAQSLAAAHRFFHWPLEFADVFYDESGRARQRAGLRRGDRQSAVGDAAT